VGGEGSFDITIKATGGGLSGQAQAVKLGIARALCTVVPENQQKLLRSLNLLTRDARKKERRKFGLKKLKIRPHYLVNTSQNVVWQHLIILKDIFA
jgi:small subunit ribosomal protein S9